MNTVNADPAELHKFSALADRWWDEHGEFKPLHQINPLRLGWMEQNTSLAGKRVLDAGCGGGILSEAMAARGGDVTGIDLAESSLQVARKHAADTGAEVTYRNIAVEALASEQPASFDVIACLETLEHVPDPGSIVQACTTLAKPGGWVFFSTLNRNAKSWLLAIVGAEYVLGLLPRGTHDHQRFIKPSELDGYCRQSGLQLKDITGLTYNPLTRVYRLGSDTDVNYMLALVKKTAA